MACFRDLKMFLIMVSRTNINHALTSPLGCLCCFTKFCFRYFIYAIFTVKTGPFNLMLGGLRSVHFIISCSTTTARSVYSSISIRPLANSFSAFLLLLLEGSTLVTVHSFTQTQTPNQQATTDILFTEQIFSFVCLNKKMVSLPSLKHSVLLAHDEYS